MRTGAPCQDAVRCAVLQAGDASEILIACVSDGAGSASQSEHGARLVVDAFQEAFAEAAREAPDLKFLDEACAQQWLAATRQSLRRLAEDANRDVRDYACTFLGAVVGESCAVFIQIGDGAIVVGTGAADDDSHAWVFWPQHGEFANSTFFVTMEEANAILQYDRRDPADGKLQIRELAMFSDGLERLILDITARTVHSPSLRPILDWLATNEPFCTEQLSSVMLAYLNSANVNRRTDDDKSLVVATRVDPPPPRPAP